jgi:UDP-glucose 4-epimerase
LILKNKYVVVTGGAGFIGSNLVQILKKNNKVKVIDNLSTGYLKNIKDLINNNEVEFVKGTITNLNFLQQTFKGIDYVFHLAAIPSVPRSVINPIRSNNTNINGTLNVLVAARNNNVKKVIYSSSSSVYGDTPTLPKKEAMKPCPLSPYAVGKLTGEYYCQVFKEVYNLSTISLRYFNVYGPQQDKLSEYAAVIPKFITLISNNKPPIIFGDGQQTRDFTFVKDAVNANILAAKNKETGVFNIACGKRISVNELAKLIMKITGKKIEPKYKEPRPGDIKHSLADISKAKQKLGYVPKTKMQEGLEETIEWFHKQI